MSSRAGLVASLVTLVGVALGPAPRVHAGDVERFGQIAAPSIDSQRMVLRYDNGGRGLLYSDDRGKTASLLCGSIEPGFVDSRRIAMTRDGRVVMSLSDALFESDDESGCTWSRVESLEGEWVFDFARSPDEASDLYAVTSAGGRSNGIYKRTGPGAWVAVGEHEEISISRLRIVRKGDGMRFYESIVRGTINLPDSGVEWPQYVIRYSDDEGQTWTEHELAPTDGELRLEAVDPSDPERLVVSVNNFGLDDVFLVSNDAGKSFDEYLTVAELGGIASAPDGRFWFGDAGSVRAASQGVSAAASLTVPAVKLAESKYNVFTLAYFSEPEALYATRLADLGSVDLATGAFDKTIGWDQVQSMKTCAGVDMAAVCELQLCSAYCGAGHFAAAPLCEAYDTRLCGPCADGPKQPACIAWRKRQQADAGATTKDASADAEEPAAAHDGGCGCSSVSSRAPTPMLGSLALACLGVLGYRRRRRQS